MGVFSREEEETLAYDADAFFYFAATVLLVVLIPWSFLLLRHILYPSPPREENYDARDMYVKGAAPTRCATAAMEAKRREAQLACEAWGRRLRPLNVLQIAVIAAGWLCFFSCTGQLRPITNDPHTVLGLLPGASLQEIKKAYRKMSLQHHPDKDRDNPLAHTVFQHITKAYRTLTDEGARKNYERYGNPDGPTGMKVGIALHPVILLSKETQLRTLIAFFTMLFGVPLSLVCCCLRGSNLSTNGVSAETLRTLSAVVDSEVVAEDGPGLLAASAEAQRLGGLDLRVLVKAMTDLRPQPLEPGTVVEVRDGGAYQGRRGMLRTLGDARCEVELWSESMMMGLKEGEGDVQTFSRSSVTAAEPHVVCPFSDPPIRRCAALIWAHMWRLHAHMQPAVQARVDALLRISVRVVRAAVSIAAHGQPGAANFETVAGLVNFRRAFVQAMEVDANPLLQLPHVSKVPEAAPPLDEVVRNGGLAPAVMKELKLGDEERLDIEAFCRHAPRVKLECKVEVPDEDHVAEGDLAALTITLRRTNLAEGEAAGPVHAPYFPGPKYEEWWILVYDERARRLVTTDLINGLSREESCKVHFMVQRPGKHQWRVHALCDSYLGLDAECAVHFTALKHREVSHEVFTHPEDAQIKTLFEELMEGLNPEEIDEDSSDDEPAKPAEVGLPQAAAAAAAQEKDSDSESEGEVDSSALFYKASAESGIYIYHSPEEEQEQRMGSAPRGTVLRASTENAPPGWAQLTCDGGAWIKIAEEGEEKGATCVGRLGEQDLRTVVQTRPPLSLVKRWLKHAERGVTSEDLQAVGEIEDSRVRMLIEEMMREKLGDTPFEKLLAEALEAVRAFERRLLKARGFFCSQNGIVWHVSPRGFVRGLSPDGSRLRDHVEVTKEDTLQIGPFRLDETRSCSCIHWLRLEDESKSWVWSRDCSLRSRVRLGLAF